jgi:hypothetical protein
MLGSFSATYHTAAKLRHKDDPWNVAIAGFTTGALAGLYSIFFFSWIYLLSIRRILPKTPMTTFTIREKLYKSSVVIGWTSRVAWVCELLAARVGPGHAAQSSPDDPTQGKLVEMAQAGSL